MSKDDSISNEEETESLEKVGESELGELSSDDGVMSTLSLTAQLEIRVGRLNKLREIIVRLNKEFLDAQSAERKALLEEHGLLEQFDAWDVEIKERTEQDNANLRPISESIRVLSDYRMALVNGKEFGNEEILEKVANFEALLFSQKKGSDEGEEAQADAEETEENSEE